MPWKPWATQCGWYAPMPTHADTARAQVCLNHAAFDFHDRIMERLRMRPEIVSASPVVIRPFMGPSVGMSRVVLEGQSTTKARATPSSARRGRAGVFSAPLYSDSQRPRL